MTLNYVNLNDEYCRNDFIRNTPVVETVIDNNPGRMPEPSEYLTHHQLEVMTSSTIAPSINVIPETVVITPKKRIYQKLTQDQLDLLKKIYNKEGPLYPLDKYSCYTGIKSNRLKSLICSLKKGECIDKSTVKKGRNRKLTSIESNILVDLIKDNNRNTLNMMKAVIKDKSNISVSITTLHRHLKHRMVDDNLPNITLKRFVPRGSCDDATSIEALKDQREIVVQKMLSLIGQGYRPIFIDEAHWQMGLVSKRARSDVGVPAVVHMCSGSSEITVIASMSDIGMHFCQVIYGSNSIEVFNSYIRHLLVDIKPLGRFALFMDNVNLHHNIETETLIFNSGNLLLFNTIYSPPMNPIENVVYLPFYKASSVTGRRDLNVVTI